LVVLVFPLAASCSVVSVLDLAGLAGGKLGKWGGFAELLRKPVEKM